MFKIKQKNAPVQIRFSWFVLLCFLFFLNTASARVNDSLRFRAGVLPSMFYTPETRLGFGGLIYTNFKFDKYDSSLRKSNSQTYVSYTLNKQLAVENDFQFWLAKNRIYLTGNIDFSRFPELFFGIGNDTKCHDQETISFDLMRIVSKSLLRVKKNLYTGLLFQYQNLYNLDDQLMAGAGKEIYGDMGYTAFGVGPILILDKRDNPLNPCNGSYLEASYVDYANVIQNKHMFTSLHLDARKYFTFKNRLVWNGNIYFSFNDGEVPFRMLPEIGGARFLRGYYRGRFRDNNMILVQQEFRMPVYKFIGVAAFAGVGSVSKKLPELVTNKIHTSYGLGLRICINKKENTNIRIDYGFGEDSHGLYVVFAEAF
jgi:outer membrane protein assembly factor BamA